MERERIGTLLEPYLGAVRLSTEQLDSISTYINLLSKWNARMNLTAVRDPEDIVRRHFGESLFAAWNLLEANSSARAADVGSGAGFPGIPMSIYSPAVTMTLIEAHGKKATFLREVIRSLRLTNINVYEGRAENWAAMAQLVVLRAVEKFEAVLPIAASRVSPGGRLGLLVGRVQLPLAQELLPGKWADPLDIPESGNRVLFCWQKG